MGIIGAGHVGGHVAMSLVIQGICRRVMLIDTDEKKARAQADDLMDGLCHLPWPVEIKAGSYEDLKATKETVETGWQIVLGKGSTEFGVASAAAAITRAILRDEKRAMPCSALLTGQYGQEGVFASALCVIGRDGAEEVWQLPLNQEEEEALVRSCEIIRRFVKEH